MNKQSLVPCVVAFGFLLPPVIKALGDLGFGFRPTCFVPRHLAGYMTG
jgi:hypothetical protein